MDRIHSNVKVLVSTGIAGVIFIYAVYSNKPLLLIAGAVFDLLPLLLNWMNWRVVVESGSRSIMVLMRLHIALTIIAYTVGLSWIATSSRILSLIFLELWWIAVILESITAHLGYRRKLYSTYDS